MKKYLSVIVLSFAAITLSFAQNAKEDKRVNKIMNDMQQACNLSPDQAAKVQPIVENYVQVKVENGHKYASKDSLKMANQENLKNFKKDLLTVITPEQVKQYYVFEKQKRSMRRSQPANAQQDQNQETNGQH
jgi:Tfp pilus assembly protein PilV